MNRRVFTGLLLSLSGAVLPLCHGACAWEAGERIQAAEPAETPRRLDRNPITYYVAPSGDDAATGTKEKPWRTLEKSLGALQPGDTLYVRGGEYVERVKGATIQPATEKAPIRVLAYPGERPVLRGLLRLDRPSYWTVDGLNVIWDPGTGQPREHMVKIGDGVGWTFKNAEVWNAQSYAGVLVYSSREGEPRDWRISGCRIHDTQPANRKNQDHLIYVNTGVTGGGGVIERNLLYNASNGSGIKIGGPSAESPGTGGVTVRYNTIFNCAQGILVSWRSRDNQIYRNLIGGTSKNYGAIRGYQLVGENNVARENAAFGARLLLLNDEGFPGVRDGGDNRFPLDPDFDSTDDTGFHPRNSDAAAYGRYAQ